MRTPPVAAAPSAPPGRSRHETAPADPLGFPALLTKTEARTAVAEGHTKTDEQPGHAHAHAHGHARRDEAHAVRDERAAAREERLADRRDGTVASRAQAAGATESGGDAATTVPADATSPAPGETPPPTSTNVTGATAPEPAPVPDPAAAGAVGGTAPESADGSGTGAGGVPAVVPGAPGTNGAGADDLPGATPQDVSTTPSATATVSIPAPGTPGTPGTPDAAPVDPGAPAPVTADATDASATAGTTGETSGGEQADTDTADADADGDAPAQHTGQGRPGGAPVLPDAASDRSRAAVAAAHDGVPTRAHGEPGHRDAAPAAAPAVAPVPAAAAQAAQPAPAVAPAPAAALPAAWTSRGMAQTVERLVDLVHVATARGVARAKLQLHPQELGGIEVRLRQSAEGLIASITAQRADGLEAVTQAGAELRRSLEDRGLTLARLDISLAADGHGDRGWHGPQDRSAFPGRGTGRATRDGADPLDGETVAVEPPTVTTIPGAGVLVDVQA